MTQNWIFKHCFTQFLNIKTQNVNKWLTKHLHSMAPHYEAEELSIILNALTFTTIYGIQKKDILHEFITY